ncbi:MAG: tagaturonate reductase [Sphingobacteriaceae bacterium]|jgi:tagaturonate reductase|nr:tagaturonate reductase [Sphingobacteriaceae bacterium]
MILSRSNINNIQAEGVAKPSDNIFSLPEKVLQFGTGVLLRGLPDYFIDKANRSGIFNGRIIVVKSTDSGSSSAFDEQDGLYTLAVKGIENNKDVEETIINSAISRVLSASSQWQDILQCAHNPDIKVIISNTTEVGIQLEEADTIDDAPPKSFPGKLLAFLYERFKAFNGSEDSGLVIVPTELIVDNGKKLKDIIIQLADINKLESPFLYWLNNSNHFCNSLVDRIVPGKPDGKTVAEAEQQLGYSDSLYTVSEVYRLWAIEGGEKVKSVLAFAEADPGVIIADDIEIYRELKLRLLNGTHTLSCGLAFLSGFPTVKAAMDNEEMSDFISTLMLSEIATAIPYKIPKEEAKEFANKVLDRFRNPHIEHLWINITVQFTAKLKMRIVPLLLQHYKNSELVPERIAAGFAGYMLFMRSVKKGDKYFGEHDASLYPINDDQAGYLSQLWEKSTPENIAKNVLSDISLWGTDLSSLTGFEIAVRNKLNTIIQQGALKTTEQAKEVSA